MLSRVQYESVIQTFFVELNHLCLNASDKQLRSLPKLESEIDNCLAELREAENDAGNTLYNAFVYLDEFVHADWSNVALVGYEAYKIVQSKENV
jgi:hypothetical protein